MHDIDLIDKNFDKNIANTYTLSIQTGLSGLCFSVLNNAHLKYIVLRHYPFTGLNNSTEIADYIRAIYAQDDILKLGFKEIRHAYSGFQSTLVPEKEFVDGENEKYWNFVFQADEKQSILHNPIASIGAVNIFNYPAPLYNCLNELFPRIKFFNQTTSLIEHIINESTGLLNPVCFVNLNNDFLSIGIAKNAKLMFFNSYVFKDKTDVAYYILGVLEQYGLPAVSTNVYFSSNMTDHDELFDFLNDYLGQIKFARPSSKFSYSILFDELFLSQYTNLFNLALCE